MKSYKVGKESWERVGFIEIGGWRPIIEKSDGKIEIGERHGGKGLYKDVDNDIRVIEVLVELVAEHETNVIQYDGWMKSQRLVAHSFRIARLARQSYS